MVHRIGNAGKRTIGQYQCVVIGAKPSIAIEQPGMGAPTQVTHHRAGGMHHVIRERSSTKGQPAMYGQRAIRRYIEQAPRHFRHTREAGIKIHRIEFRTVQTVAYQHLIQRGPHGGGGAKVLAGKQIIRLARPGPRADIDQTFLRNAKFPRFGKARHQHRRALVDRRIGHHQLGIRKGDGAVVDRCGDDFVRRPRLFQPRPLRDGGHVGQV